MMVRLVLLCVVLPAAVMANAVGTEANPIEKVIEMLGDLQQKIIGEGKAAQAVYDEFAEWCEEESKTLQFEIKTGKAEAEELTAVIEKAKSDIKSLDEKIESLSATLATDEADLKAAMDIREKEHALFVTEEADLIDTVDILERAIGILEREMAKNPALVQIQSAGNLLNALSTLLKATSISSGDASRLTALVQSKTKETTLAEDFAEEGVGAPDPAVYKNHGGGIIEVLTDLLDDAQGQLAETRKKETESQHNFDVLKVEIEDAIKFGKKELDKTQKKKAEAGQTQATAEGDLAVTNKALSEDIQQLADTHHDCMTKAQDFEAATASRGEELKALAEAKKIISEMTGGAAGQTYSFLQVASESRIKTRADLANFEVVRRVEALAHQLQSTALAQLAQRMDAAARLSSGTGDDPFAKVKGLIADMIERLLKEAEEDAKHKAYCDKEMSETNQKKDDLTGEIEKLTTKIDKMTADSAQLKEEVAVLTKELADLAKSQAEMDKIRGEEAAAYKVNKAEMEEGLEGVKLALKVLRDYYSKDEKDHEAGQGAGDSIIGILEVVESDFSKGLSEATADEDAAQSAYEEQTQRNVLAKATKEQDRLYKTKESKQLEKSISDLESDRANAQDELDAVNTYWAKITEECIAKAEPYEERKRRREEEIAGLEEALKMLEAAPALVQKSSTRRVLRGVRRHT